MATPNSRRNKNALASDLYTTPQWAVAALLKRETFIGDVLDPGCGKGDISDAVKVASGNKVTSIDLYDWGYEPATSNIDFLEYQTAHDNTIMNPPFKLLNQFINHAIEITTHKVAVFCRINAIETQGRWNEIFSINKPSTVYPFVRRVKCNKGGHDNGESSSVFYCWIVWDKNDTSNITKMEWIDDTPPEDERPKLDLSAPAIHVSDVKTLLDETIAAYRSCFTGDDMERMHIVSTSGGKDSTVANAICNIATEGNYRSICCDTDNENQITYDYIADLHNNIGNNAQPVEMYKLKIPAERWETRREHINRKWRQPHVIRQGKFKGHVIPPMTEEQIQLAISLTKPTGNTFFDLCILHGSMPTRQARFCTQELKVEVALESVLLTALAEFDGEVINWSGIRAEESESRSHYNWLSEDPRGDGFLFTFLPIHRWKVQDIWALHKYLGIAPNPLYLKGASRVGCWPCIMSTKEEIRQFSSEPAQVERLNQMEWVISRVNRYGYWRAEKEGKQIDDFSTSFFIPRAGMVGAGVHDVVRWAMTDRKGDPIDYDSSVMNCSLGNQKFCE